MNFATLFKAFDTMMVLRDTVRRIKGDTPQTAESGLTAPSSSPALPGQIEARLTTVVVAALKEAFDRDHARLELERAHMEEQRRRADDALRAELRRHAADREVGRLRMLAGTALVGWIASMALFVARLDAASVPSRAVTAAGWLVLLAALGVAFTAQGRVDSAAAEEFTHTGRDSRGAAALWLLIAGLALTAIGLLF